MGKTVNCWMCGAEHDYCPTCDKTHGWKYVACSARCYQIYLTLEQYNAGVTDRDTAIDGFAHCDIKQGDSLEWLLPPVAKRISEIIGEKEKEPTKITKKSKLFKNE